MRVIVKVILVVVSLSVLYWPGIVRHWEMSNDPYFVPFDAVQYVPPFFKFDRNHPIPTTHVKEYYLNAGARSFTNGSPYSDLNLPMSAAFSLE
jgi:hypothetical protein